MKNKKIFFILFILIIAFFSACNTFRSSINPNKTVPVATFIPPLPPQPSFPNYKKNTSLLYKDFVFPDNIPTTIIGLNVSVGNERNTAMQVAKLLGLTENPTESTRTNNAYYTWSNDKVYLEIGKDPKTISYGSSAAQNNRPLSLSDSEFDVVAKTFIKQFALLSDKLTLSPPVTRYVDATNPAGKTVSRNSATLIQMEYQILYENFPILTTSLSPTSLTFKIDGDGQIFSIGGVIFPDLTQENNSFPLLNKDEAYASLQKGDGVLASYSSTGDENNEYTDFYSFSNINIKTVSLAYYYTPGQKSLSPIFLFKGTATDYKTKKTINTTTVMSAFK